MISGIQEALGHAKKDKDAAPSDYRLKTKP